MKIVLIVSLCFLLGLNAQAQTSPDKKDEEIKITNLSLAKKDSEGNIVEGVDKFNPKDIPIYCYVDLNTEKPTLVKMTLIAVKAKGMRPNSKVIVSSYKTKKGENGVTFNASPKTVWAVGDYRVDIFLNGKLAESKEFSIEAEQN